MRTTAGYLLTESEKKITFRQLIVCCSIEKGDCMKIKNFYIFFPMERIEMSFIKRHPQLFSQIFRDVKLTFDLATRRSLMFHFPYYCTYMLYINVSVPILLPRENGVFRGVFIFMHTNHQ